MAEAAFKARYDIVSNAKKIAEKGNPNMPPMQIAVNFTPQDAVACAQWLMAKAEEAEREGRTFKEWDSQARELTEKPGFTLWGSCYGQRGELSALPVQGQAPAPAAPAAAPAPVAAASGW